MSKSYTAYTRNVPFLCAAVVVSVMLSCASATPQAGTSTKKPPTVKTSRLRETLEVAMGEALAHVNGVYSAQFESIKERLLPTFSALPQNSNGHIEPLALRTAVHRYFMQQYGMSLRAFEPHRPLNTSELHSAEVLQDRAPAYVEALIRERFANNGFAFTDSVAMIATLEQMLFDDTGERVQKVCERFKIQTDEDIPLDIAGSLLQAMYAELEYGSLPEFWMSYPVLDHAVSELKRVEYERIHATGDDAFGSVFRKGVSFKELQRAGHRMVQGVSMTMTDCRGLRRHLSDLDSEGTGRVDLTRFYLAGNQKQYDFSESKGWLRQMGALDESSAARGPQVIIPNYVSSASNCRLHTPLYRVCCPNAECDGLMAEVEKSVGAPAANPDAILPLIQDTTDHSKRLRSALESKLRAIAQQHNGVVPLHGRLFSQWLHFASPHACPFPHKRGHILDQSLGECGKECLASLEEKESVIENDSKGPSSLPELGSTDSDDSLDIWLAQWSHEEELVNGFEVLDPQTSLDTWIKAALALTPLSLVLFLKRSAGSGKGRSRGDLLPTITHHSV